MTLNVLTENSFKNEFERNLVRIEVTDGQLMQTSSQLFLAIYVQKKSSTLNVSRGALFRKRKKAAGA